MLHTTDLCSLKFLEGFALYKDVAEVLFVHLFILVICSGNNNKNPLVDLISQP